MNLAVGGWLVIVWYARGWILCVSMVIVHASSRALKGLNFDKDVYDVKVLRALSHSTPSVCCHAITFLSTLLVGTYALELLPQIYYTIHPGCGKGSMHCLPACLLSHHSVGAPAKPTDDDGDEDDE